MKKIFIIMIFTITSIFAFNIDTNAELISEDINGNFTITNVNNWLRSSSDELDAFSIIQRFPQQYLTTWDGQITSWVTEYDDSFFNTIDNFTNGIQISLVNTNGGYNTSYNYQVVLLWQFSDAGNDYYFDADLYWTTTTTSQNYWDWNFLSANAIYIDKVESFIPYVAYDLSFIQENAEDDANYISVNLGNHKIKFDLPTYNGNFDTENTSSIYNLAFKLFDNYTTFIDPNDILNNTNVDISIVRDDNLNAWYDNVGTSYNQSYGAYMYYEGVKNINSPNWLISMISGTIGILGVEVIPNFPLATFVFIPLFFGLLTFFFKLTGKRGIS